MGVNEREKIKWCMVWRRFSAKSIYATLRDRITKTHTEATHTKARSVSNVPQLD